MLITLFFALLTGFTYKVSIYTGTIFLLFMYFQIRKNKWIISLIFLAYLYASLIIPKPIDHIDGVVVESYDYGCVIKDGFQLYFYYNDDFYPLGTNIQGNVKCEEIKENSNFNAFSFRDHLYSKRIFYQLEFNQIKVEENQNFKGKLITMIDTFQEPVNSYTKQLLLGIKDEYASNLYSLTSTLSLLHLFALSGMHLSILEKWLKKLRFNDSMIMVLLGVYVFFIRNMISLWRAYLFKLFHHYFHLESLDALALTGILLLIYNPYMILGSTFQFVMIISFFIEITKKLKYHEIYPYLASIPLILHQSYELPLFGLLYSYICSGLIEIIFSLLLINCLCLGKLSFMIKEVISVFENCLVFLNDFNITLIFEKIPICIMILIYSLYIYLIMYLQLNRIKKTPIICLIGILMICYCYPYIDPVSEVSMIDVGQGDCFLIKYPYDQGNVLIDTGGSLYSDMATKRIIPYLKSRGIKALDYVIITHDDFDHSGALSSLNEHFTIRKIIDHGEDFLDFHWINLGYQVDENAKSLVYTLKFQGKNYLFTGDLPLELEKEVCKHVEKIDVLKVGHHGSNTSTSSYLLEHLSPDIALISVGANNHFGHPTKEVLDKLEAYHVKVYRSDLNGMVRFFRLFGQDWIQSRFSV